MRQAETMTPAAARPVWPVGHDADDPLAFLDALARDGGDVVPFHIGRRQAFLLNHPACVDEVLKKGTGVFIKGRAFEHARHLLGTGLLTADGDLHRARRRVSQGAFHRQRLDDYVPDIWRRARLMSESWQAQATVDVAEEMRTLTLAVAGTTLFGVDLGAWAPRVAGALATAMPDTDGLVSIVAPPSRARRARRQLDALIDEILAARQHEPAGHTDLLSLLVETREGPGLDTAQLRDDVLTFVLASHDTVSHALTWTWLLLDAHPDVDSRLAAESRRVLGTTPPRAADVSGLAYTRAVIAEALRLFPPAWVIVRRAAVDATLGGIAIPAGAVVVASPWVLHRDGRFFDNPLQFRPERWLDAEDATRRPRHAYFPFGAGPRACIGEGFAWLEATLVLATLARDWRLARTSAAPVRALPRITLRAAGERPMALHARASGDGSGRDA